MLAALSAIGKVVVNIDVQTVVKEELVKEQQLRLGIFVITFHFQ